MRGMRMIRLKSGGHVNICGPDDVPPPGEVYFTEEEYHWALKISSHPEDPEAQAEFWKTVMDKKLVDYKYSVFTDFPAPRKEKSRPQELAEKYAVETINMLKGRGAMTRKERDEEAS